MAYRAIYRKWRPMVFEDIVGQEHITRTLKNQIANGRVSHAYLFCGTRGTGKTTAAKVFSRAVNCLNPQDGSPCNECDICKGIIDGSIMDVTEIDAASNNKVDDVRQIIEDVGYVSIQTQYRVYIVDEVHMLSTSAFNALLKTLEEPPEHVIFILATTEPHKLPETILSRCQRFDFKRIRSSDIILRMKEIAQGDGLTLSEDALTLLAQLAEGSMRDGLSLLERCVSAYGNSLTEEDVINALGISGNHINYKIIEAIINNNPSELLSIVNELMEDGKDLNVFMDLLITYVRDMMVCKVSDSPDSFLELSQEEIVKLKSQSERITLETINNAITVLSKAKADAKWEKSPRTIYELALIKLTRPELDTSADAMLSRLSDMEDKIKDGISIKVSEEAPEDEDKKKEESKPVKKEVSGRLFTPLDESALTTKTPVVAAARNWDKISATIMKKCPYTSSAIINRRITIDGEGLILIFKKTELMNKKIINLYLKTVERIFQQKSGTTLALKTAFEDDLPDRLIDYWNVPEAPSDDSDSEQTENITDPLLSIGEKFPEITEYTDESEFIEYKNDDSNFSQAAIEEDDSEEFLSESEQLSENGDDIENA